MKSTSYQQALWKAMKIFLDTTFLASISGANKSRWTTRYVILMACLMNYSPSPILADAFQHARMVLVSLFAQRRRPGRTYQGFVKARRRITQCCQSELIGHLQSKHQSIAKANWQRHGWVAFAVDGTQLTVPRTQENLAHFGRVGQLNSSPQMNVTTLYHMGTGLPWAWQQGTTAEGERTQLKQLIPAIPAHSLLVADAGYTGYDVFSRLLAQDINVLIRVGANTTLLKELGVHFDDNSQTCWLWPLAKRDQIPIRLRLIHLTNKSGTDVYLLTNILDEQQFSDQTAATFYQMRWGVEVFFRHFKQTYNKTKLRSQSPQQAEDEFFWAMISMLLLGLMSVSAISEAGRDPLSLSVAMALRTVRYSMTTQQRWRSKADLRQLLQTAIKDDYSRHGPKTSHNYPRKKHDSPPAPPNIRTATMAEKRRYREILKCA